MQQDSIRYPISEEWRSISITREILSAHIKPRCLNHLIDHVSKWKLLPELQSAYHAHYSMQTAVLCILSDTISLYFMHSINLSGYLAASV